MSALKILPLGGLGEIGMNCMVLETEAEILVVDCGLLFSDLEHLGVEFVIPDFAYLKERREKVKAFVITHGHEDHIGALAFALKAGIQAPIYASAFASLLIRERLTEAGLIDGADIRRFKIGDSFKFEDFKVRPIPVNHSIVDSFALVIDTPVGKVIHTGDFKIDATPFIGKQLDMDEFRKLGEEGVALLMSDSTNVERHEHSMSESVIYQRFEELFAAAEGLMVVSMFASNVGRMGQVLEIARKQGRKVALAGRSMSQNVALAAEVGYLKGSESVIIGIDQIDQYPRNRVIVLSTGSQGEHRAALIRMANGEHSQIQLQQGDTVLMSSKFIPGNEKAIGRMINNLFKQGAEVLYESIHDIHVSGHATRPELKQMIEAVRPEFFMPIHGEYRHLVHHSKLASECGMRDDQILLAVNGDVIALTKDSLRIVEHNEEQRVLVAGREGTDIPRDLIRERRRLGEKGVVFTLMVRNGESRRIIAGPEILLRGIASEEQEVKLIEDSRKVVKRVIGEYDRGLDEATGPAMDLQETVRVELRRFFNERLGKKPTVLPIVIDV